MIETQEEEVDSEGIDLLTRTKVFEEVIIQRVREIQGIVKKNNQKLRKNLQSVEDLSLSFRELNR